MLINGVEYDFANTSITDYRDANLSGANLSGISLRRCCFDGADLSGADLHDCDLGDASFVRANLTDADLRRAHIHSTAFTGATLTDANFRYARNARTADFVRAIDPPCIDCLRSTDDCECMHCSNCGERSEVVCERCDRGRDCGCCTCYQCGRCDTSVGSDAWCPDCDNCTDCCTSDHDDDDDQFRETQPSGVQRGKRGECQRLAGVEYETTQQPDAAALTWARKWSAGWHSDGSCGYEAVTPPCAGSKIDACISELADVIGDTDKTCGIHVHVDASDYRWADTMRFLRVFAKVEPLLYVLGGQQRLTNNYCEPCGADYLQALASDDPKNAVLAMAYGVRPIDGTTTVRKGKTTVSVPMKAGKRANRHSPGKKLSGRYKSINIAPWVFGRRLARRQRPDTTFEFRLHRNGDGAERVIGWTHLCVAIVEWSQRASEAQVAKLPRSALRALCKIAPSSRAWILRRVREWRNATKVGPNAIRRVDARNWTIKRDPAYRRGVPVAPAPARETIGTVQVAPCDCSSCVANAAASFTLTGTASQIYIPAIINGRIGGGY